MNIINLKFFLLHLYSFILSSLLICVYVIWIDGHVLEKGILNLLLEFFFGFFGGVLMSLVLMDKMIVFLLLNFIFIYLTYLFKINPKYKNYLFFIFIPLNSLIAFNTFSEIYKYFVLKELFTVYEIYICYFASSIPLAYSLYKNQLPQESKEMKNNGHQKSTCTTN